MNDNEKKFSKAGLLAAFPTEKSFREFQENKEISEKTLRKFLQNAYEEGIIKDETEDAFLDVIWNTSRDMELSPLEGEEFESIIEKICQRPSPHSPLPQYQLIQKLNLIARKFGIKDLNPSTISRLKTHFNMKTPTNQITIRILAYWIGENFPDLHWNYEKFWTLQPPDEIERPKSSKGVVLAFSIQGKRGIVESDELLKSISDILSECVVERLNAIRSLGLSADHLNEKNISSHTTYVSFKLFKKPEPEESAYIPAIRDSLAIAHQMVIRWLLSKHSGQHRLMLNAIYAGAFSDAELFFQMLLEERISEHYPILLNDLAYQWVQIAKLKVAFKSPPSLFDLRKGYPERIWFVDYFWLHPYFDFVPALRDSILAVEDELEKYGRVELQGDVALARQKFPHHPLLLIEIVKVLLARKRFDEADRLLTDILVLYPHHILARLSRMFIYEKIASQPGLDLETTEFAFKRALAEVQFIPEDCKESEVWSEVGAIYYANASSYFIHTKNVDEDSLRKKILDNIEQSRRQFFKGIALSPDGKDIRSLALCLRSQTLKECVIHYTHLLDEDFQKDSSHICYRMAIRFFKLLRILPGNFPVNITSEEVEKNETLRKSYYTCVCSILTMNIRYQNSVMSSSFSPNTLYFFGCLLWDFLPVLTRKLCWLIYMLFRKVISMAAELRQKKLTIYVTSNIYPEDPQRFIELVKRSIEPIKRIIPDEKELEQGIEFWETILSQGNICDVWKDHEDFKADLLSKANMRQVSGEKHEDFKADLLSDADMRQVSEKKFVLLKFMQQI